MTSDDDSGPRDGAQTQSVAGPPPPDTPARRPSSVPLVTVVGFHHARGPEVETWFGADPAVDPAADFGWSLLPFMALSDGAHASEEDFSYFTLLRPRTEAEPATSLFGISCTRQIDSARLVNRPADVTRSTVQKAVVVIADSPQFFGMLRERLSIVTQAWFAQRDFADTDILRDFQESLADEKARGVVKDEADRDQYLGMSLRELIHEFKWQTLVLFKCCLLQPKMLFSGSRCDRLCMVQYSLISLIPGLLRNLHDCADPELNSYEETLAQPSSLQSSNRSSLLSLMGLPLQIFGKGSFFGPYTPLQQLDVLADFGTKSYLVGSTNSLLLQQKDRYSDILINLDEDTVAITSPSLKSALALTAADRRWIDFLTHEVNETWDETNPSRPKTMQYVGSEEFIRSQFEAYIIGLISSVKFHNHLAAHADGARSHGAADDPAVDFGLDWVEAWTRTENYRMWDAHTDSNLFSVSEPKHPCAGGLSIDDVQRRIAEQVKELHLDERFAQGREMLGRNLAVGREKASTMLSRLYSDVEHLRESQRRRADETRGLTQGAAAKTSPDKSAAYAIDLARAQQTMQSVGVKAGAYMSSWAAWAGEKRKTGGWGAAWGRKARSDKAAAASTPASPVGNDYSRVASPAASEHARRPPTQASFSESILSAASDSHQLLPHEDAPPAAFPPSAVDAASEPDSPAAEDHDAARPPAAGAETDGFHTEPVVGAGDRERRAGSGGVNPGPRLGRVKKKGERAHNDSAAADDDKGNGDSGR